MSEEDQTTLFYPDPPPESAHLSDVDRAATAERAGTRLDPRWVHEISSGNGLRGRHGLLDESKRLYQTGGERKNFIYWKRGLVSIALDVWQQVEKKTDWIEIIDHERNECWRIAVAKARKNVVVYEAGAGQRVGIPIKYWDVINAEGNFLVKGRS